MSRKVSQKKSASLAPTESTAVAPYTQWLKPLRFDEAIRAAICMLPMLVAFLLGQISLMVPLGQGGFYYSSLPLSKKRGMRFINASLLLALGLGFYLMGGNASTNPILTVILSFLVGLNLVLLVSWRVLGMAALSFVTVYSAGLNTGDPMKAQTYFFFFLFSIGWGAIISMLPIWKGQESTHTIEPTTEQVVSTGFRMGLGMSVAVFVSYLLGFSKLGWAPSGVASSVRFDWETSKIKGFLRELGTILGAVAVMITFFITLNPAALALLAYVFGVINGLMKETKVGAMPLFYTMTILLIYSINDIADGPVMAAQRVFYNLIGVLVALLVVWYPFPRIMSKIKAQAATSDI